MDGFPSAEGASATRGRCRMEASCLELALEGERLCRAGEARAGASFFEAAVRVGTEDARTLSAIYSQLGNAYVCLGEHGRALEYHGLDLTLARKIGDRAAEAKASGNLGNPLKFLGRFEEAIVCCQHHLDVSREIGDQAGEARALYLLGSVYHTQGKSRGCSASQDPGELGPEAKFCLEQAVNHYQANLALVRELGDRAAQGRAFGNLGNTYYLLGCFSQAVACHQERLAIAREFGDKGAERRAYSNLGNAHIFLGQFESAAEFYKKTLQLARQLRERAVEAQACYSLGNTCTLMQDYCRAVDFHLKHLAIAQELQDRVGEARACFSLGNAHSALGSNREAVRFVTKHLELSREIGDRSGEATARANLEELHGILAINNNNNNEDNGTKRPNELPIRGNEFTTQGARPRIIHRHSVDNMELMKLTIDKSQNGGDEARSPGQGRPPLVKQLSGCSFLPSRLKGRKYREGITTAERRSTAAAAAATADTDDVTVQLPNMRISPEPSSDSEGFFEQLSRSQADRMDDQRCSFLSPGDTASSLTVSTNRNSRLPSPQTEELLDLIMQTQGRRLDDQRATGSDLPGLNVAECGGAAAAGGGLGQLLANGEVPQPDDDFFDMLVRCQGSRLDDQRCAPPPEAPRGPTVPDEDFLSLIQRTQAKRLDEQRVSLPPGLRRPSTS
ncbi:G-protein-signaling modulator 2-like isoform X2 [Lethenteron reissneri]|uniref:G-protein-signaling modulator 2-like isoform X2 n=1 Tax=Lethenteron reissneri TaxID=7753 RepID=UPI002AB7061F|nr:G-protein-signaling modulator 2-like isoform X2 [Lethenteron reissneri]